MRAHIVAAARALARRWPSVAAVAHRELDTLTEALRDPRLDELACLIEDGRLVEARALLAALSEDLGPGHQDLVGAVWEFNMAEQSASKTEPVEVSVYRPAFNEPHGTQRLCGVAGVPMSHEEATRTLEWIAEVAQAPVVDGTVWDATPAKPSRVLPGQVWRCVGEALELEVLDARPQSDIGLRRLGTSGVSVRAREVDMLGLKEWSFERGPR